MNAQSQIKKNNTIRLLLALAVGVASIAAATFGYVYPSNYSPIIFWGGIVAVSIILLWVKFPVFALYAVLFVVLFPTGIIPYEAHSQINRVLTLVAFAVWILDVLIGGRRIFINAATILMLVFLAWSLLTVLWANNFDWAKTLLQAYVLRFLLFIFLMPNIIRTRNEVNGLFIILALNGWVLMTFTIVSLIQNGYTPGSRFHILESNENAIGLQSLVTLLGVLWVTTQLSERNRLLKTVVALIYSVFVIFIVFASGSRGSAISLSITMAAFLLWRETRYWGLVFFSVILLAVVFYPSLFITTIERFLIRTSDSLSLLGGREILWSAALEMIGEHPIIGVGIGNSGLRILPYLNLSIAVRTVSLHNPFLVIASETGLLGFILYLGILISSVMIFIKRLLLCKFTSNYRSYFALVSSVFVGYMIAWIKGGGMEMAHSYFFMLALLLISSSFECIPTLRQDKKVL